PTWSTYPQSPISSLSSMVTRVAHSQSPWLPSPTSKVVFLLAAIIQKVTDAQLSLAGMSDISPQIPLPLA
ncbi:hypothetical protein, partial [Acinetobacter baumannii]|uniref:hypothetical protein n=1 Tax=Acinetobacter baumannii TaxID=470 RepID=UPI0031F411B9